MMEANRERTMRGRTRRQTPVRGGLGVGHLWLAVVALVAAPGAMVAQEPSKWVVLADTFVEHLQAARWSEAGAMVAPAVASRLGAAELEQVWGQVGMQAGALRERSLRRESDEGGMRLVEHDVTFERAVLILRTVWDEREEKLAGFWLLPPNS
jgi:hypothetical protein